MVCRQNGFTNTERSAGTQGPEDSCIASGPTGQLVKNFGSSSSLRGTEAHPRHRDLKTQNIFLAGHRPAFFGSKRVKLSVSLSTPRDASLLLGVFFCVLLGSVHFFAENQGAAKNTFFFLQAHAKGSKGRLPPMPVCPAT